MRYLVQSRRPIRFQLHGMEGRHGFSITGSDVSQVIEADESSEVTWTPDKPGEYTIKCNVMCGSGHGSMQTVITVTDDSSSTLNY
jgi:cytochrome c oxidase subunit 2